MALVQQNFQAYLRSLRIIFAALLISQVMVLVVLYVVRGQQVLATTLDQQYLVRQILPIITLALASVGFFLYRRKLMQSQAQADLKEKLNSYRVALLLRWMPLEIMSLIFSVLYFLTGRVFFLYFVLLLIPLFIVTQWPTRANVVARLGLGTHEQAIIDDPNAVVSEISQRPG